MKKLIIASIVVFGILSAAWGQDAGTATTGSPAADTQNGAAVDEKNLAFTDAQTAGQGATDTQNAGAPRQADFWPVINTVIILFLILAAIYGFLQWTRKRQDKKLHESGLINLYASKSLTASRNLNIVRIGNQWFFIGDSEAGISLISELKDKETIDSLLLAGPENRAEERKNFSQMLTGLFSGKAGQNADTADFLAEQKNRLGRLK